MEGLLSEVFKNTWVITILGGALATVFGSFFVRKLFEDKKSDNPDKNLNHLNSIVKNKININIPSERPTINPALTKIINPKEINYYKETAKILFIDDLDLKNKIGNLVNAGWKNVSQITEADNIDAKEILEANVIFVDYKGVGKKLKEKGLAVAGAIKNRYANNKWVILYSAHPLPIPVGGFDKKANTSLAKNSDIYELEQKILEGLGELNK